ncbi:hypothetical protein CCR75_007912 [Bremia lactucae]|uniref:Uncharacterized protein n=1 Tax=Bremia lactucae TaxID=4779 RepID=A0A976IGS5_BRELC|nr:hypothetical protein CCR75_007912 [Bremia lactucae]
MDKLNKCDGKRSTTFTGGGALSKLQPELLCPTVGEPLDDLDHWGVPSVLCVMLLKLAPVEDEAKVVILETKAALCH